jgi:uncharacterized protein (DUF58 family)
VNAEIPDLLDPASVARIGSLEVAARILVEGFIKGLHFSSRKGSSIEFAEHRAYVPGDEVRRIDWRTFGKTDRFYLKEYEDETNLRGTILLDCSASMGYGSSSPQGDGPTKLRYGQCLAAALGFLMVRELDAVGLLLFDAATRRYVPPKASAVHLAGVFGELERARPAGATALGEVLRSSAERVKRRGLVILISDLLDDPREVLRGLARFRHRLCEVLVFHVLDPAEREFPFTSWTVFRDPEPGGLRLRLDARQIRAAYRANLEAHLAQLKKGCGASGIHYTLLDTRTPFDQALARYLATRRHRA